MKRIQRRREPGWQRPPNTVYVGRPSPWGNPWTVGALELGTQPDGSAWTADDVVRMFRQYAVEQLRQDPTWLKPLVGRNLECWCDLCPAHAGGLPFGEFCADCPPCHADVLGVMAIERVLA